MDITSLDNLKSQPGSPDWFTGSVRLTPLHATTPPSMVAVVSVTFEAKARTAWHTHPLGQTLIITAGTGYVQRWGEPMESVKVGDVIWFPSGEKHWHGAGPEGPMTHLAIHEAKDGKSADWLEQVSDEQYRGA